MSDVVERKLYRQLKRSCERYALLAEGDRVMVALSGGKDSYTMLTLLDRLVPRLPFSVELVAVHLDQVQPGYDGAPLVEWLEARGGRWEVLREDTYSVVTDKLDAGATRAITQFFHEPDTFFRYRDAVAAAGISAEIVPGIMPIANFASVVRMSAMCGTAVPDWMARLFEGLDDKPAARQLVSATIAAELSRKLYAGGVKQLHFYTLNRAELAYAICHLLGVRATDGAAKDIAA